MVVTRAKASSSRPHSPPPTPPCTSPLPLHPSDEDDEADGVPAPLGLASRLPPRRLSSMSDSRKASIPLSPSLRHRIDPLFLRSLSLPAFQKLRSFARQRSDVFVIRSVSINGLQDLPDAPASLDVYADEKEVSEDDAVCRICMLELNEGNEMLKMECSCKGDLALAHKDCAVKWFSVKGNNRCDVCNSTVLNLPVLLFRRSSSLLRDSPILPREEENSSWHHAVAILLSSVVASLWDKLQELSEFP